jgi:hypothetical protein
MKPPERRGNGGPWKTKENQNQVSLRYSPALGNRRAISTFSTAPTTVFSVQSTKQNQRKELALRARLIFIPSGSFFD